MMFSSSGCCERQTFPLQPVRRLLFRPISGGRIAGSSFSAFLVAAPRRELSAVSAGLIRSLHRSLSHITNDAPPVSARLIIAPRKMSSG
jgi:hypothetical protein